MVLWVSRNLIDKLRLCRKHLHSPPISVGSQDAGFGTASADLHRARRKAISRFFSQSAISSLEESVDKCVKRLCERVKDHRDACIPVNVSNAFRCLASDVITQYRLPQGLHLLDSEDFAESYN